MTVAGDLRTSSSLRSGRLALLLHGMFALFLAGLIIPVGPRGAEEDFLRLAGRAYLLSGLRVVLLFLGAGALMLWAARFQGRLAVGLSAAFAAALGAQVAATWWIFGQVSWTGQPLPGFVLEVAPVTPALLALALGVVLATGRTITLPSMAGGLAAAAAGGFLLVRFTAPLLVTTRDDTSFVPVLALCLVNTLLLGGVMFVFRSEVSGRTAIVGGLIAGVYGSVAAGMAALHGMATGGNSGPAEALLLLDCAALAVVPAGLLIEALNLVGSGAAAESLEAAKRDALTGLYNRRVLESIGPGLFAECHNADRPVSLLMMDIDHFKRVNDLYGHAAGDAVLRRFAEVVSGLPRSTDLLARYGGEEFALVLPGAPLAPALRLAEQIRSVIESSEFPIPGGAALKVTSSLGVATAFPGEISGFLELMETADRNLYRAKRAGRNRVMANPLMDAESGL